MFLQQRWVCPSFFKHSPTVYLIVKLVGAVYLVYLGYRYFKPTFDNSQFDVNTPKQKTLASIFAESVLVEVTNPKTALFFIAFLPQFVSERLLHSFSFWGQLLR